MVDGTIGAGLTVALDDRVGHDVYQQHELHKQFIERNSDLWARVQVYDHVTDGTAGYA